MIKIIIEKKKSLIKKKMVRKIEYLRIFSEDRE